jgi:hypothetical protein
MAKGKGGEVRQVADMAHQARQQPRHWHSQSRLAAQRTQVLGHRRRHAAAQLDSKPLVTRLALA